MFTFFKQYKKKAGAVLFAIQLLIVFALPIDAAYAAGTSRPGNDVCFALDQCFATMGECQAAAGGKICSDPSLTKTAGEGWWAKRWSELEKAVGQVKDLALDGTVAVIGTVLEFIAKYVAKFAGFFMRSMGAILDMAIGRTINGETYRNLTAVLVGWTAVRDFSNMLFIFVLLYIAIQTILGLAGSNAKRLLSHVVIAALLINFSLFFTQVVIDAGNILAMGFWNQMMTQQGAERFPSASAPFLQGFRMQTIFDINGSIMTETPTGPIKTTSMENAMIYAGGAIMMFVAGYVFLAGAVIMIVRTVWLLILMIGSPFAFLSYALPSRGGFASWWWGQLIGQVFVAPAFLFMLYICSLIISSNDLNMMTGAVNAKMALAFVGRADNYAIIYNFAVMIILLLACLTVANKVSSGAGSMGSAWAKKIIGGGAALGFAGVAAAGRQTYGRNAAASLKDKDGKETEWAKKQRQLVAAGGMKDATFLDKSKARLANSRLALAEKGASGTYDIRNAPMGGLGVTAALGAAGVKTGAGDKKSYETHGQALGSLTGGYRGTVNEKELIATAKARFPNDPAAQKAYLEGRGVSLTADRNKDARDNIDAASKSRAQIETKSALEAAVTGGAAANKKLEDLRKERLEIEQKGGVASAALVTSIDDTAKSVQDANEQVKKSLKLMSGEDVAKLMNKKEYRESSVVRENLATKDYAAINKAYLEGKYKESMGNDDQAMMANLTVEALRSPKTPEATKRSIKNAMKNGTWGHEIDFKKELNEKLTANATDKEINETWAMLDNEDKADLKELLLHERIASRVNGATLGAIGKRGNEGFYDDVPEFREKLTELHTKGVLGSSSGRPNPTTGEVVNTAASHIDKNSGKLESYYYQMPKSTAGRTAAPAAAAATNWNLQAPRMAAISANVKRHHELSKKSSTAPSSLTPQESAELASLNSEIAALSSNEKSFADDVKSKLS